MRCMRHRGALTCTDTVIHQAYPTGLYYAIIGQIRPISLYTSKTPGQSGSLVTGVPVRSRVSVTDPVPSLVHPLLPFDHRRQPRRGCRGRIPTNILVGWDINGNVRTNIRGGNVVEYELLIARVKRKQR